MKPPPSARALTSRPSRRAQVKLPGRSVKDLESTQNCTQVFVVLQCQPKALRVDIGPHTYLLGPGDHFFVPQSCQYRLMNFSDTPAEVSFVVIKPTAPAAGV